MGSGGLWLALAESGCLWLSLPGFGWLWSASRLGRDWAMSGPFMAESSHGNDCPDRVWAKRSVSDKPHMGDGPLLLRHAGELVFLIFLIS